MTNTNFITAKIDSCFNGNPLLKASIFGSTARLENNKDSDLDILIELDYCKPIDQYFAKNSMLKLAMIKQLELW